MLPKGTQLRSEAELQAWLKDNSGATGFAVVKSPGAQKYVGVSESELQNWLRYEDGVAGRLGRDRIRQQYAVLYENAAEKGRNYIRVKGQELSAIGTRIFIDRKLQFPNFNNLSTARPQAVLDLLWRVTQALEQNSNYRWAFEFKAKLSGDERVAFQKAKVFIESIKRNDASAPKFGTIDEITGVFTELADSAHRLTRIRKMLGIAEDGGGIAPKIEFRNEGVATSFPQKVVGEGATASVQPLKLDDMEARLPQARQYWIDAGAPTSALDHATFQIGDLPTALTERTQITLDTIGAG